MGRVIQINRYYSWGGERYTSNEWVDLLTDLFGNLLGTFEQTDPVDDFDRIERQQEANRLLDLIEGWAAGTIGYEQFMAEFNTGDTFDEIPGFDDWIKETRDTVQYDSMLNDWAVVSKSGDPQAIQDFVSLYNRTGIQGNPLVQADLASKGSATAVITGTIDNSILEAAIKNAAMGDGDWVATVDFENLPGYGGIWEGFIRHIEVSVKGLGLPIPDWLPLPGIFDLPSIGEIFDTVTGPWKDASRDALRNCMDPDGDGVDNKSASQCLEEQSVVDILVEGIGNATEQIWDKTADAVQGILDETIDCASNPTTCAQEVFDKIKDIFGEGAVDPTATGGNIPDWLKVIIIGGAYGDEILGELEDLFGGDIDGDELIGTPEDPTVTPPVTPEFDCASVFKSGGTVTDESQCGGCLQGYDPDGQGGCIEAPIECPGEQVYNELTGQCEDPEPGFVEGDPCKTEAGESGTYDAQGNCVADAVEPTPCGNNATPESGCERCSDGSLPSEHENGDCSQPKIVTETSKQGDPCKTEEGLDGTLQPVQTLGFGPSSASEELECVPNQQTPDPEGGEDGPPCDQPKPGGFEGISWSYKCRDTHCTDGSLISDHPNNDCSIPIGTVIPQEGDPCDSNGDGVNDGTIVNGECVATPEEECAKPDGTPTGATVSSGCEQCPDGYTFDFNGICQPDGGTIDCSQYNRETNEDGTCGGCLPGFQKDTSLPNEPCVAVFDGCPPGYELVNGQCTAVECPEGQAYCIDTNGCEDIGTCPSDTSEEGGDAGGGGGGAGGGGGRRMFEALTPVITASPQLLTRQDFPITDFLAGIFTNSTGGQNV